MKADRGLPEPELEHLFKVLLALDSGILELPEYVRTLKIEVVKRLIDRYHEGYPAEEKQKVLAQLAGIEGVATHHSLPAKGGANVGATGSHYQDAR